MTFEKLIGVKRKAKKESFKDLAKALKISEGFAKNIQYSRNVAISPKLALGLAKHYRIPLKVIEPLLARRNRKAKAWTRNYRAKA